jgi:Cu/Ag efflux protein CusF
VLSLAGFAAGIWGSYRAIFPAHGLHRMTAVVESVSLASRVVLVGHEAVSGLMEPMSSMALVAESRQLLDRADLRPGDRVRFTLRQLPDSLVILDIQKIR